MLYIVIYVYIYSQWHAMVKSTYIQLLIMHVTGIHTTSEAVVTGGDTVGGGGWGGGSYHEETLLRSSYMSTCDKGK